MLHKRICRVYDALTHPQQCVDFEQAWRWQRHLVEGQANARKTGNDGEDSVILLQHDSIYTLGRGSTLDNLKFSVGAGCPYQVGRSDSGRVYALTR
jgi:lipoyl(octanoyl) transferase